MTPTPPGSSPSCDGCTSPTSRAWRATSRSPCRPGCGRASVPTTGKPARGSGPRRCRVSITSSRRSRMGLAVVIGAVALAWAVVTFNRLTRLRQLGDNAWADIDVQLKRRHDLIPSVVAVVKGHAGYERETLEALVAARGRAVEAASAGPTARYREEQSVA